MVLLIQENGEGKGCFIHPTGKFSWIAVVLHSPKDKENSYGGQKLGYLNFHKMGSLLVTEDTEVNALRFPCNKNHLQICSLEFLKEKWDHIQGKKDRSHVQPQNTELTGIPCASFQH